jgi:hypothetical protein
VRCDVPLDILLDIIRNKSIQKTFHASQCSKTKQKNFWNIILVRFDGSDISADTLAELLLCRRRGGGPHAGDAVRLRAAAQRWLRRDGALPSLCCSPMNHLNFSEFGERVLGLRSRPGTAETTTKSAVRSNILDSDGGGGGACG